jgi:Spy/CpxP family protein refolding chaperone
MLQSNLVLMSTAALLIGAGVVVGRLSDQWQPHAPPPHEPDRSRNWLSDQLKLTPDQHKQMDAIWEEMRKQVNSTFGTRRDLQTKHKQAIDDLFTAEQRSAYHKINSDYQSQMDDLFKERDALMQEANAQSRALLDPDQQKKWDLLTKEMSDRRGPPGGGPGWGGPGGRMRGPGGRGAMDGRGGDHHDHESSTTRPSGGAS